MIAARRRFASATSTLSLRIPAKEIAHSDLMSIKIEASFPPQEIFSLGDISNEAIRGHYQSGATHETAKRL
jgi:hypothetical protein